MNIFKWFLLAAVAALLLYAGQYLPLVGDPNAPAHRHVSPAYIESGLEQTATPNIVTTVLADYRSYDTLGEVLVILTASLGCFLLMNRRENA